MKRTALLILISILFAACAGVNYKLGNQHYKQLEYAKAIPYLEKSYQKKAQPKTLIRLAECYQKTNNTVRAEGFLKNSINVGFDDPRIKLEYARVLQQNGKLSQAVVWYNNYLAENPEDEDVSDMIAALGSVESFFRDSSQMVVEKLKINSKFSDFAPSYYRKGIIFCSERNLEGNKEYGWTGRPYIDIYYSRIGPLGGLLEPVLLSLDLNSEYHEGPAAYNNSTETLFFTRSNFDGKKLTKSSLSENNLQIFTAFHNGGSWGKPAPFAFNNKEYSLGHPTFSRDGSMMVFVSDMPGSKGLTDLYICRYSGSSWSQPEPLPDALNTGGKEMFPFYLENKEGKNILYFASDGHPGLGGLDIFYSEYSNGLWSEPKNLGYPINSSSDDFGLISQEDEFRGFFSSNRGTGEIDNLFSFGRRMVTVLGEVVDKSSQKPIQDAGIIITLDSKEEPAGINSDELGKFSFRVSPNEQFRLLVSKESYKPSDTRFSAADAKNDTLRIKIELEKPRGLYIVLQGKTLDAKTGKDLGDVFLTLEKIESRKRTGLISDADGKFDFGVIEGKKYSLAGKKENYYLERMEIDGESAKPNDTIYVELKLRPYALEKPIVLKNIYYDLDKWFIRKDAEPDLNHLAQVLHDNPEITIELMSHTDSRASDKYNERLSNKRALSARDYLIAKGINPIRIVARGYGENILLNHCGNDVKCSEAEHQVNRRTEFKITKVGKIILSSPKDYIPVNTGERSGFN